MTTITSHSLTLIPLQQNLCLFEKRLCDDICTMNGIESVLPHSLIRLPKREEAQMSPQDCYVSENSLSNCDMDPRPMHGLDSKFSVSTLVDDGTNGAVARSSSTSSYRGSSNKNHDEECINYCSDDSVLSVGKEVEELVVDKEHNNDKKSSFQLDSSFMNQSSNRPKQPFIVRPNPTRQEEFSQKAHHIYDDEVMKHQLNFMTVTKGLNISTKLDDQTLCPSPYLKPSEVSSIHNAAINNSLKIGFTYLQAYANDSDLGKKWSIIDDRSARSPETTHFRQIHTHLNAISKITSTLGRDSCRNIQMTSPGNTTSRENSQSPPSSNASSVHHSLHNTFSESNLKFSIDNILKPSFGRRITDPLLKRNKPTRKNAVSQRLTQTNIDRVGRENTSTSGASSVRCEKKTFRLLDDEPERNTVKELPETVPVDLIEKGDKTTAASGSTSDSNSTGPLSWPAWVYCTRYSDRPSSGKYL